VLRIERGRLEVEVAGSVPTPVMPALQAGR
jgi:hypothetical protein